MKDCTRTLQPQFLHFSAPLPLHPKTTHLPHPIPRSPKKKNAHYTPALPAPAPTILSPFVFFFARALFGETNEGQGRWKKGTVAGRKYPGNGKGKKKHLYVSIYRKRNFYWAIPMVVIHTEKNEGEGGGGGKGKEGQRERCSVEIFPYSRCVARRAFSWGAERWREIALCLLLGFENGGLFPASFSIKISQNPSSPPPAAPARFHTLAINCHLRLFHFGIRLHMPERKRAIDTV